MQGGKLPYINIADKVKDNNRHRYISINFQCCHGIKLQLYVYFGGVITLKKLLPITVNYCQSAIENQKSFGKSTKITNIKVLSYICQPKRKICRKKF